jgi:lipoate-protein ligase A
VEALTCRLFPYAAAPGAVNMALDELLAEQARHGEAALRFYGWTTATLSLGYFQPAQARHDDPRLAGLPWVRRPSGGAALVHHHELTYALALPPGVAGRAQDWLLRMHLVIGRALAALGVAPTEAATEAAARHGEFLCFLQQTPGDLLCRGHKVVGSAQRKYRQALLQHGSVLLAQSEHTPALPGLRELTGVTVRPQRLATAITDVLAEATSWRVVRSTELLGDAEALVVARYGNIAWNERR